MRAVFPKSARSTVRFEWDGGFFATSPIYSNPDLLPQHWSNWPGNPRPELTRRDHESMLGMYAGLWDRWRALPLGQALVVQWPLPEPQSKPT